jgi:hypothetical protein
MNGLTSGFGVWNPIAWALLFVGILGMSFIVRSLGNKGYKRGTGQTKVFLSGNEEPQASDALHIRGDHLYWGMIDGLSAYYRRVKAWHTGILSDYAAWFIGVLGLVFVILVLAR